MRIGIANNLFPPFSRGSGAEVIAEMNASDLRAAGHDVFMVSTKPHKEEARDSSDHYFLDSAYFVLNKKPLPWRLAWHIGQLFFPWHLHKLNQILDERQPDLFITHNLMGIGFVLPRLLRVRGIRHEHVLHDIQLLHPSGLMYWGKEGLIKSLPAKIYQLTTRSVMMHAAKIISPSRWLLNIHQSCGFFTKQESAVEQNFNLIRKDTKLLNSPVRFVFTGQLEKHKGLSLLLNAWQEANLPASVARLTIAGGGTLEKDIRQAAADLDNLDYAGLLSRDGIENLLTNADVVVVPSLVYENSPTSLWEAAVYGCRGLAADIGGIPELSPYLDLTLFAPGDRHALARAIIKMATMQG